jgi:hypothetical protein
MKNSYILKEIEPSISLKNRIIEEIRLREFRKARFFFYFSSLGFILSFIAVFPAFMYLSNSFYQSGFIQYVSAIFSDGGVVFTYWKEYLSLVVESAPIFEVSIILTITLLLLFSFKTAIKNVRLAF